VVNSCMSGTQIKFLPVEGCRYKYDYERIMRLLSEGNHAELGVVNGVEGFLEVWHQLVLNDLWFVVFFIMGWEGSNHPFVVDACREVEDGPETNTVDIWARGHGKSTVITGAEIIQRVLRDPEERVCIMSHKAPAAKAFLRRIKHQFETNERLKLIFPDVLWENPHRDSPKWSEDEGIILKRTGIYTEATVEAAGLIEGMPTGKHYTYRVYDDIMVQDYVKSPERMRELESKFKMSEYLSSPPHHNRVIGTFYHHSDILVNLVSMMDDEGEPVYHFRKKPAVDEEGVPHMMSMQEIKKLKMDRDSFRTQYLLDPTPSSDMKLRPSDLRYVKKSDIPKDLMIYMTVDPAGDAKRGSDSWAMWVIGVDPETDEVGAHDIYLLNGLVSPLGESEGIEEIARMYLKAGVVQKLGIEKVGLSTAEVHIKAELKARGRRVNEDDGSLVLLRPSGRNKVDRIIKSLEWPLRNGKIHIVDSVPTQYSDRLVTEMEKFPFWHDDALDALSYIYDIIDGEEYVSQAFLRRLLQDTGSYVPRDSVAGY